MMGLILWHMVTKILYDYFKSIDINLLVIGDYFY